MQYNVLDWLENSAERAADKTAAADRDEACTYSQLRDRAMRVGSAVAETVMPRRPVAVMMEKGVKALYSFLGAVYADCFYVLFNPSLPEARLSKMQEVLSAGLVIADEGTLELAKKIFSGCRVCLIDELLSGDIDREKLERIRSEHTDTSPLYANFTSGSTGTPKAVVVGHRSVIDFIDNFTDIFGIDSTDIIANQAPFDFDVSVKDIYSALKTGAELVTVPKELFSSPKELMDLICEKKITTMTWAVSALCLISTFHGLDYRTPDTVKRVLFSGEVMPIKHLKIWLEKLPQAMFVNLYGPTEITCNCTYHIIDRERDYSSGIPMGKAFPNERVFLIDADGNEVTEPYKEGEICVGGSCLAIGYYGDREKTDKVFTQDPLSKSFYERIYHTGDVGKYIGGELFFGGRIDFQIKYNGHRIELEEIERAVNACSGVESCCCVFDGEKEKLYCFYVGEAEKAQIHSELKALLPVYMIPGAFRNVEAMPLTKNGKTDRKLLLEGLKRK